MWQVWGKNTRIQSFDGGTRWKEPLRRPRRRWNENVKVN
jgi:hypothetical protein